MTEPTEAQLDEERAYILAEIKARPLPDGAKTAQLVSAILASAPPPGETWIPTRFPYTYAADFVRVHPQTFRPYVELGEQTAIPSRSQAAEVITRYAAATDQSRDKVAEELARGYLHEYRITGWTNDDLKARMLAVQGGRV